jgi:UDP-2,3-diacylglucosamine hydrolase
MLALIAGQGRLPVILAERLRDDGVAFSVFALDGFAPDAAIRPAPRHFRIEHLGSLLETLIADGVGSVCFAGAIRRPPIDPTQIDTATKPLLPKIKTAIASGDDAALRLVIGLFAERGLTIRAAHEIAPDLLCAAGVPTRAKPGPDHERDAQIATAVIAELGTADLGQACVVAAGQVLAREDANGTDAMLRDLNAGNGLSAGSDLNAGNGLNAGSDLNAGSVPPAGGVPLGVLFKAPKPGQDRRADLPTIGPETVDAVAAAGLAGIVIQAGGVLVLDLAQVIARCDASGLFLWLRDAG